MNLTDEEIRIKVAEAMGWTVVEDDYGVCGTIDGIHWHSPAGFPNYTLDLNACTQFEDELKKIGVFSSYLSNLALVCGFNAQGDEAWFKLHAGLEAVCSATARQRCLAFVQTKGLIP